MCLSTAAACPADRSCLGGMRSDVSALNSKKVASHHRHSCLPRLLPQNTPYNNLLKPEPPNTSIATTSHDAARFEYAFSSIWPGRQGQQTAEGEARER